ncbi:MAG: hypothetical protein K2M65_07365, partial [Muribaculaceae bacterium]|nr:hypothetical protein [Muribaculaceae bacterium]
STSVDMWEKNKVNAYVNHNYYELLRANPAYNNKGQIIDSPGDAFPGTGNITQLTNTTEPSLRSWTGLETGLIINDIAELPDGRISFTTKPDSPESLFEDFEKCQPTEGAQTTIQGNFCSWALSDGAKIESISDLNDGKRSVAMTMGASMTSAPINQEVDFILVDFYNPTYYLTTMTCQYSPDNGKTWHNLNTIDNEDQVRIASKTNSHVIFKAQTPANYNYRFTEIIGNRTSYIDNISFLINKKASSSTDQIISDKTNGIHVTLNGSDLSVICEDDQPVTVYTADGRIITTIMPTDGYAICRLPHHGVYIIRQASNAIKILY